MAIDPFNFWLSANDGGTPGTAGSGTKGPVRFWNLLRAIQESSALQDVTLNAPPSGLQSGYAYFTGTPASGAWAGQDNKIAVWDGTAWNFYDPILGMPMANVSTGGSFIWDGTALSSVSTGSSGPLDIDVLVDNSSWVTADTFAKETAAGADEEAIVEDYFSSLILGSSAVKDALQQSIFPTLSTDLGGVVPTTPNPYIWIDDTDGDPGVVMVWYDADGDGDDTFQPFGVASAVQAPVVTPSGCPIITTLGFPDPQSSPHPNSVMTVDASVPADTYVAVLHTNFSNNSGSVIKIKGGDTLRFSDDFLNTFVVGSVGWEINGVYYGGTSPYSTPETYNGNIMDSDGSTFFVSNGDMGQVEYYGTEAAQGNCSAFISDGTTGFAQGWIAIKHVI